jgi:hypothetical protein
MSAKDTTVNIRVSGETKARWQKAAGGPRQVSAWLTKLANDASSPEPLPLVLGHGSVPPNIGTPSDAVPADQGSPGAVVSGTSPDDEGEAPQGATPLSPLQAELHERGLEKSGLAAVVEQESSAGQCPRWMHHRSGVYCGTCKRVN